MKRTNEETTYLYTYLDGQLTHMKVDGQHYYFTYAPSGTPIAMTWNGANYYYVTNLQGDITHILDNTGAVVTTYTYNAWGKLLSVTGTLASTVGRYNPLRYRGYIYDTETGLYYLQSRYYNPEIGRFINADGMTATGQGILGNNMFAYCNNNPVNTYDPDGMCMRLGYATIDCRKSTCITSGSYPKPKIVHSFSTSTNRYGYFGRNKKVRDVTTEINEALAKAVDEAESYVCSKDTAHVISSYYHFGTLVYDEAAWDIKVSESWEKTIGTPFPGEETWVIYHGVSMTPQMLGNYTYGYLGYAYDIPLDVLIYGSYVAAGMPLREGPLRHEAWDWTYIDFGYWKAMQDCV